MASCPIRWPLRGWRRTKRPPSTASSVTSSAHIRAKLMAETGVGEKPACTFKLPVIHQDTARQEADGAFQHAHVPVEHVMMNVRALEQRFDIGDQHRVVGPDDLAHC